MSPQAKPRAVLSAGNISHYHYAALALQRAGYLQRYLFTFGTFQSEAWWHRFLSDYWRTKLRGRQFTELRPENVRTFPLSEMLRRSLTAAHVVSGAEANLLLAQLYGWMTATSADNCDVFHFVSTVGFRAARRAKHRGSLIVCDLRTAYPDSYHTECQAEYERLNLSYPARTTALVGIQKAEFALADHFIVPSSYVADTFVQAGYNRTRIHIVPYGVNIEQLSHQTERAEPSNGCFRIIFTGATRPGKGVSYLVEAFQALDIAESELWLVGGMSAEMKPWLQRSVTADPRIKIIAHMPKSELWRFYQQSSVFVLPSLSDSFGLVTLEAMLSGLPAIVTDNTGTRDVIRDGIDGFVVPARDTLALRSKLRWLFEHAEERVRMGAAAAQRAQQFTWEAYGDRLIEVYNDIWQKERG